MKAPTDMGNDQNRPASDRDPGLDRLLRETLSQEPASIGSECLDAETLAAWCDGALAPSERAFAEAHAARCGRCRAAFAAMVRTAPEVPSARPWSVRHWTMMLMPAAAAATAVALWFAVEPRVPSAPSEPAVIREADARPGPANERAAGAPPAVDAPARRDQAAASPRDSELTAARTHVAAGDAGKDAKGESPQRKETLDRVSEEKRTMAKAAEAVPAPAPASIPPASNVQGYLGSNAQNVAANANAPAANAANTNAAPAEPKAAGERVAVTSAAPMPSAPPPPASPAPAAAQASQQQQAADLRQSDASMRAASQGIAGGSAGRGGGVETRVRAELSDSADVRLVMAAPGTAVQWRVVSERVVQQSSDKGATWVTQYTLDAKSAVVAGAATSPTSAWLVGRSGLVLVTADGRTWRRATFPHAIDLLSVAATDARNAIVTAADKRVFVTSDGGATWTARD